MKRNWINAVLLLLVLGLGTLIWLTEGNRPQHRSDPLTQLRPDHIGSISISNKRGSTFSMKRDGNHWRMTQPYTVEANGARVRRLLEIVISPVRTQFKVDGSRLAEFGLAPPAAILNLDQLEIRMGGTEPINHYRYLAIEDNLYLTKDLFPHLLLTSAETYVSPNILPSDVELDLIRTPEWQLARTQRGAQVWQLTPTVDGISIDRLTEKVDEWKNAQALKVVKAPAAASNNRVEIRVNGSSALLSFLILRQQQGTLLIREDLGLGYQLPRIDTLLALPAMRTKVP